MLKNIVAIFPLFLYWTLTFGSYSRFTDFRAVTVLN